MRSKGRKKSGKRIRLRERKQEFIKRNKRGKRRVKEIRKEEREGVN